MVADVESLVGGVNDDGIVGDAESFEAFHDSANGFVDTFHAAEVIFGVPLIFPTNEILPGEICFFERGVGRGVVILENGELGRCHPLHILKSGAVGTPDLMPDRHVGIELVEEVEVEIHVVVNFEFLPLHNGSVILPVIEEGRGLRDGKIFIEFEVAQGRHPVAVGSLMLAHEEEGLIGLGLFCEPVHGEVGDDVGAVAQGFFTAVGGEEVGVVVVALAGENFPCVKALGI